ncbi:MAG: hypothetical protein K0R26_2710 [Bacteroidota bacterium]|jgi:uncharacterized protein YdhG (YjbR/CyaY superfamily)|nr:hypothetical protein [Bacteroidota bacterium]
MNASYKSIDDYISKQDKNVRPILAELRKAVLSQAPQAEECISYNMPAFRYHGILVYFAAFKNHIGFYALPSVHNSFQKELSEYKQGRGSVQFPLTKPIPYTLIKKMVKFRVKENLEKIK